MVKWMERNGLMTEGRMLNLFDNGPAAVQNEAPKSLKLYFWLLSRPFISSSTLPFNILLDETP